MRTIKFKLNYSEDYTDYIDIGSCERDYLIYFYRNFYYLLLEVHLFIIILALVYIIYY